MICGIPVRVKREMFVASLFFYALSFFQNLEQNASQVALKARSLHISVQAPNVKRLSGSYLINDP
jgi:hypothetical protein